jgi:4-amino-4-deoxy-L-arabinose transferase-like glycosyltransferase
MPVGPDKLQDRVAEEGQDIGKTAGPSGRRGAVGVQAVLVLLGLCGAVIVLLWTSRYGAGTFIDSTYYVAAARSLLAGEGYRGWRGELYTGWPPLYPTLLAATGIMGMDPQAGARWLNSLTFGLIVWLSGQLFLRCTTSRALALAGTLAVLAAGPLLAWCVMIASEPMFIVLAILFALCIPGCLRRQNWLALILAALLAGLACLQRYVGVTLIMAGGLLIGLSTYRTSLRQRIGNLAVFGIISVIPGAVWCLRNYLLAGLMTVGAQHRFHRPSNHELIRSFYDAVHAVGAWLLPWMQPGPTQRAYLKLAIVLAGVIAVVSHLIEARRRRWRDGATADRSDQDTRGLQVWSVAVVGLTYFGFLVVSSAGLGWVPRQRHMVPLLVFVMAWMAGGIDGAFRLLSGLLGHRKLVEFLGVLLCVLWLQYPLRELARSTGHHMREGAGGYAVSAWQDSPLVGWLRNHPLSGKVYSNGPDAAYLLTGTATTITPENIRGPAGVARWCSSEPSYVVWFRALDRPWLYNLRELLSRCQMQEVATFSDGGVYRYLGKGGPGISGVYRFWSPKTGRHLYTIQVQERDRLLNGDGGIWKYEGLVFYAFPPGDKRPTGVLPVYELWSSSSETYLYTMDEAEKDQLVHDPAGGWTCKGVAFYAWPQPGAKDAMPVYCFRSEHLGSRFYTLDEQEKASLLGEASQTWTYEGIAWYAYGP